jgi:hypothetical protein
MTTDCSWNYHENYKRRTLSYCGLVDARISASEKDLPVRKKRDPLINKRKNLNQKQHE